MGLRLVPTSVTLSITLNGVIALILRHFTEFDRFGGLLRQVVENHTLVQ